MRFRIKSGGPTGRFVFDRVPAPPPKPEMLSRTPTAADLDNPYGRCFGKPRSWEELLGRK